MTLHPLLAALASIGALAAGAAAGPARVEAGPAPVAVEPPTFAGASSAATRGQARRLLVPSPAGAGAGDVLIAGISARVSDGRRITPPTGWRRVRTTRIAQPGPLAQTLYVKVAGAAEPASYAWSLPTRAAASGGVVAYRGLDAADPVDAHSGWARRTRPGPGRAPARRRLAAPSVRTATGGELLVAFFGTDRRTAITPPRGMTERLDRASVARRTGGGAATLAVADYVKTGAGATGTKYATARPRGNRCANAARATRSCRPATRLIAQLVALRPAAGGHPGPGGGHPGPGGGHPGPGGGQGSPLAESTGPTSYVSTTGSDSNPGSAAAPWRTIQKALSTLRPGERALVRAGIYVENLDMRRAGTTAGPITVEAYPGERPVVRSAGSHPLEVGSSGAYFRFRGFVIEGHPGTSGGNVDVYGHHVEISANEIRGSRDQGIYTAEESHHAWIVGNWIHDNGAGVIHQSHGIYLQGEDHLVANTVIHDHPEGFGIQVYDRNSRSVLVHNTIVGSGHAGIVVGGSGGVDNIRIHGNVLAFNDHGGLETDSTCPDGRVWVDHNVIYGNAFAIERGCSNLDTSGGNSTADPLFADRAGRNLHLRPGSPAIDYSRPDWTIGSDFDGESRPQGAAADAGAFEDG